MIGTSMKFNARDMREFELQMKRLSKMPGKSAKDGVKVGTSKLCNSLRASTKIAPENRSITLPKKKSQRFVVKGKTLFYVWYYDSRGNKKHFSIWAYSKAGLRTTKIAKVPHRGAAKYMYARAMRNLYGVRIGKTSYRGKVSPSVLRTKKIERAGRHGVVIDNNLGYASSAFRNKGKHDVNLAMRKAAISVRKTVDREIEKQLQKR